MPKEFKKEDKYLVLKWADIDSCLTEFQQEELGVICRVVNTKRAMRGKKRNSYIVVNKDEPYAEVVWKLVEINELARAAGVEATFLFNQISRLVEAYSFSPDDFE